MQSNLYLLVQEGRLYATHNNERTIVITSRNSDTMFQLRSVLIDNNDSNKRLLTNYKRARKSSVRDSLQLTSVMDTSKASIKYKYMGVIKVPFDLTRENSLIKLLFDFTEADIFVVEDVAYMSQWNLLTLNGLRLDRENYQSKNLDAGSYEEYLQHLVDIS